MRERGKPGKLLSGHDLKSRSRVDGCSREPCHPERHRKVSGTQDTDAPLRVTEDLPRAVGDASCVRTPETVTALENFDPPSTLYVVPGPREGPNGQLGLINL